VPEERLGRGAVPTLGLAHNLLLTRNEATLGRHRLDQWVKALQAQAADIIGRFNVKAGAELGGAVAVGRQPAEIHRGARNRRQARSC
jgi:ABC-type uncharacterized transport system ATPase subunit